MFESLENRQLMSATLTATAGGRFTDITDGTSNTIMVGEASAKPAKPAGQQQVYMQYTLENTMISGYS